VPQFGYTGLYHDRTAKQICGSSRSDPHDIIARLSSGDALAILKVLARKDETLAAHIAEIALARLGDIDLEEVAFALYEELNALEVEEGWDRAGRTRHGYVEPIEVADEMVGVVIAPYLEELQKCQTLEMNEQANRMCMGLLLGLYKFEHESTNEFTDWAGDAPTAFAEEVVSVWKDGRPSQSDIKVLRKFIEEALGRWCKHLV
jgi:hypothetical protein